ncbi:MAG: squalene/phytoene synthase family protein [Pseudomonadota bacterium]
MVNRHLTPDGQAAERRMLMSYAAADRRDGLAALLALDDALGSILRTTRDPMVGQLRLTWWHDAIVALDQRPAPAEPVLQALARHVVPHVASTRIASLVEGWEELLDPEPMTDARLSAYAAGRGGRLFAAAGALLGAAPGDPLDAAGQGWALTDLARHVDDRATGEKAMRLAVPALIDATRTRWSRPARALGAMTHLARMPDDAGAGRVARALWHRLTGR